MEEDMNEKDKNQIKKQAKRLFGRIKEMQESGEMERLLETELAIGDLVDACRQTQQEVLEKCSEDLFGEHHDRFVAMTEDIEHQFSAMRLDGDVVSLKDYKLVFASKMSHLSLETDKLPILMILWSTLTLNKLLAER